METRKSVFLAMAMAAVLLVAMMGSASANGVCVGKNYNFSCDPTTGLSNVVNQSCTFNGSMSCPAGYGLIMGADDIIIDGASYTLDGVNSGECTGSFPRTGIMNVRGFYDGAMHFSYNNVTIENLEIKNFCNGIRLKGDASYTIDNNTIYNCSVHHNGNSSIAGGMHGIKMHFVCNSFITHNIIYNNTAKVGQGCGAGGNGIELMGTPEGWGHADYNIIAHNNIFDNRKAGIFLKAKPRFNDISHNNLTGNGQGGIILRCKCSNSNTIRSNNASHNWGSGIYVGGNYNNLTSNIVCNNKNGSVYTAIDDGNGCGISIGRSDGGSTNNAMFDNTACDNEHLDINVMYGSGNIGDENTCDTAFNYCDDSAGCPPPCVYQCGQPPEEPDLIIEDIRPVRWCYCCIEPIRTLKGGDDREEMQVMFIDDPELAKELGDEELRKEVAEVLAKDPKLAEEVAAKLAGDDDDDDDNKKVAKELSRDPKQLAELCCYRSNVAKELADLLDTELTGQAQHEMSDVLDEIVGGCCGGCCCNCLTADCCCCCYGRFIAYKIANVGEAEAGWSLSNLTVNGRVRSVDIVRPLDAQTSRWEVFPCYRMWWWPSWPREVTVCADVTDWVAESNETNNCRTEWWPGIVRAIPIDE
jgi:parallel beta-helix repeat protein